MIGLPKFLVAFPLLVLLPGAAPASGIEAKDAARILAQAQVADQRCQFLSASLRRELAFYAARAEIAAVSQTTAATASNAVAAGMAEGKIALCDTVTATHISDILAAAREAVRTADSGRLVARAAVRTDPESRTGNGLGHYATMVEAYYAERKCRHLSSRQDLRYWKAIVRLHRRIVAQNGTIMVAPVMRQAERNANAQPCGNNSRKIVDAGFNVTSRQ